MSSVLDKIKLFIFQKKFRLKNRHNGVYAVNLFPEDKVTVKKNSYGPIRVLSWESENEGLAIGSFVSISEGVTFMLGGNHNLNTFSTYPFKVKMLGEKSEALSKGKIIIEDDVWLGTDALIMSGIKIGKGAVVAARSVVTKDVPPYAVVGGNPARIIKYRFSNEIIEQLMKFDYNSIDIDFVNENLEEFYKILDLEVLNRITNHFHSNQ